MGKYLVLVLKHLYKILITPLLFALEIRKYKISATPLPTSILITTNETFKMRYCMKLYLKGFVNS